MHFITHTLEKEYFASGALTTPLPLWAVTSFCVESSERPASAAAVGREREDSEPGGTAWYLDSQLLTQVGE